MNWWKKKPLDIKTTVKKHKGERKQLNKCVGSSDARQSFEFFRNTVLGQKRNYKTKQTNENKTANKFFFLKTEKKTPCTYIIQYCQMKKIFTFVNCYSNVASILSIYMDYYC